MSRELWKMHQDQGDAFELLVLCGPKLERGFCFIAIYFILSTKFHKNCARGWDMLTLSTKLKSRKFNLCRAEKKNKFANNATQVHLLF